MNTEQKLLNDGNSGKRDERFDQLLDLAKDGVDEAIEDLWTQFGFDFRSGKCSGDQTGLDGDDWIDPTDGVDGIDDGGAE